VWLGRELDLMRSRPYAYLEPSKESLLPEQVKRKRPRIAEPNGRFPGDPSDAKLRACQLAGRHETSNRDARLLSSGQIQASRFGRPGAKPVMQGARVKQTAVGRAF
jgi:hypothetical protein